MLLLLLLLELVLQASLHTGTVVQCARFTVARPRERPAEVSPRPGQVAPTLATFFQDPGNICKKRNMRVFKGSEHKSILKNMLRTERLV